MRSTLPKRARVNALAMAAAIALGLALTACTTPPRAPAPDAGARLTEAATTPLADLNLVHAEIPPLLKAARQAPYAAPADGSCAALAAAVEALDAVLGADLDTPQTAENPSVIERGAGAVGDAAVGAVRGVTSVVPYRGWVRKLTGAERYAKEVAAAITAGSIRRAYLKGLGQAAGCQAPAAPRR